MKFFYLLNLLFLFTACSSQYVYLPNQTFYTPESYGDFGKGSVGVGISQNTEVTVIKNTTTTPPDDTVSFRKCDSGPDCSSAIWTLPVQVGLINGLDLSYKNGLFGLQYQILGTPNKEGFKTALHFSYGSQKMSKGEGSSSQATTRSEFLDGALSVGYRYKTTQMVYLTYSHFTSNTKTEIINNSQNYTYDDTGLNKRLGLGLMLSSESGYVLIETTGTQTSWSRTSEIFNDVSVGGALGIKW